jgi:hypothetical protein
VETDVLRVLKADLVSSRQSGMGVLDMVRRNLVVKDSDRQWSRILRRLFSRQPPIRRGEARALRKMSALVSRVLKLSQIHQWLP